MRKITPNIAVDNCKEALDFYKEVFGGEIKNIKLADGIEMFKGQEGKIIHAELHINDNCLMYFSDIIGERKMGGNVGLILELDSEEEINRMYSQLKNNGTVRYELQKTFWGAFHAVVTDSFGNTWDLNYSGR